MGWQQMMGMVKVLARQVMGWVQQAVMGLMLHLVRGWGVVVGMGWAHLAIGWVQQEIGWGKLMVTGWVQQVMGWEQLGMG
jgi:hypothetical protein